jgi:hypothetical protein
MPSHQGPPRGTTSVSLSGGASEILPLPTDKANRPDRQAAASPVTLFEALDQAVPGGGLMEPRAMHSVNSVFRGPA